MSSTEECLLPFGEKVRKKKHMKLLKAAATYKVSKKQDVPVIRIIWVTLQIANVSIAETIWKE